MLGLASATKDAEKDQKTTSDDAGTEFGRNAHKKGKKK